MIGPENSLAIRKPLELDIQTAMRKARRASACVASRSNRERMPDSAEKLTRADPGDLAAAARLRAAVSVPLSRAQCRRNRGGSAGSNTWSAPDLWSGSGRRSRRIKVTILLPARRIEIQR